MIGSEAQFTSKTISSNGMVFRTQPRDTVLVSENRKLNAADVLIPQSINADGASYNVASVGQGAFHLNGSVTSVRFPPNSDVTSFGERAFQNCAILSTLQLPPKLTHMHAATFRHTPKLAAIVVDGNPFYVIDDGLLFSKDKSRLLFCPRNRRGAVRIPATVRVIGEYAFEQCTEITAVEFTAPCQVIEIGDGAFANTAITQFTLPASVTTFAGRGPSAASRGARFPRDGFLQDCAKLARVDFEPDCAITEIPEAAFRGTAITGIIVPKSVTRLSLQCFAKTRELKSVLFEEGNALKTIEGDAFYSTGIEEIVFPMSAESIASPQFFMSGELKKFSFSGPNDHFVVENHTLLTADRSRILLGERTLERLVVPASVERIGASAFCSCRSLAGVEFEAGSMLVQIEAYAFFETAISTISIPDGVRRIGENAFGKCGQLKSINFGPASQLDELGRRVFGMTALDSFTGPSNLRRVGSAAFANSKVREVKFPENVEQLDNLLFFSCKALSDVTVMRAGGVRVQARAFDEANPNVTIHQTPSTDVGGVNLNTNIVGAEKYEAPAHKDAPLGDLNLDRAHRIAIPESANRPGAIGIVRKARHVKSGEISAIKELLPTVNQDVDLMKEVDALRRIRHPAIIGIIGFLMPDGDQRPAIVTEWMPGGSLEDLLKKPDEFSKLSATQKMKIVIGICKAMAYVHDMGGMHRDLKPANVLLDANYEVRIADFGSAKFTDPEETIKNTAGLGTPLYMAPEVVDGEYHNLCDVFSFAMMLWEITTGRQLIQLYGGELRLNAFSLLNKIAQGIRPPLDGLNLDVVGVLECCWDSDVGSRMSFTDILAYLQQNHYSMLGPVDQAAIREYLARIDLYEEEFPAANPEVD